MRILVVEDEKRLATAESGVWNRKDSPSMWPLTALRAGGWPRRAPTTLSSWTSCCRASTGYKVCSSLREAGNWTPVLMPTAKDGELDHAQALDTGTDDFLTKPFSYVAFDEFGDW